MRERIEEMKDLQQETQSEVGSVGLSNLSVDQKEESEVQEMVTDNYSSVINQKLD